jgi:hypothetical protein
MERLSAEESVYITIDRVAQETEHKPRKHKALSLNLGTAKKKKNATSKTECLQCQYRLSLACNVSCVLINSG